MGFIVSASTIYLDTHLSPIGRKYALSGGLYNNIVFFGLGDSDKDYRNSSGPSEGYVPDVTGDHNNCIYGVNDGFGIVNYLHLSADSTTTIVTKPNNSLVFLFENTNNSTFYTAQKAEVTLYLHDLFAMYKAVSHLKLRYQSYNGLTSSKINQFESYFTGITNTKNISYNANIAQLFRDLDDQGRSVFLDFYDGLRVSQNSNLIPTDVVIVPKTDRDYEIMQILSGGLFNELNGVVSGVTTYVNQSQQNIFPSPGILAFSSFKDSSGNLKSGSGKGGFAPLYARDYGYTIGKFSQQGNDIDLIQQSGGIQGGFFSMFTVENQNFGTEYTSLNSTLNNQLMDIVPSARVMRSSISNYYYPLNDGSLFNITNNNFQASTLNTNINGTTVTKSPSSLETFVEFGTSMEYQLNSSKNKFIRTVGLEASGNYEPNILFDRELGNFEYFLTTLYLKNRYRGSNMTISGQTGTTLNTEQNYNATVSFSFYALTNDDYVNNTKITSRAEMKVNLVISKQALKESISFSQSTSNTVARWNWFGNSSVKFYGEAYQGLSEYSSNPTNLTTTNGYNLFRKVQIL